MDRPTRFLCGLAALAGALLASFAFSPGAEAQTRKPRVKSPGFSLHRDVARPPVRLRRTSRGVVYAAAPLPFVSRGPRPLLIRPTVRRAPVAPGGYLCPRPGDFDGRCVSVRRSAPVRLEGQGSEASMLGSARLAPPRVPPVEFTQTAQPYLLRSDPRIGFAANVDFGPRYFVVPPFRPLAPSLSIQARP